MSSGSSSQTTNNVSIATIAIISKTETQRPVTFSLRPGQSSNMENCRYTFRASESADHVRITRKPKASDSITAIVFVPASCGREFNWDVTGAHNFKVKWNDQVYFDNPRNMSDIIDVIDNSRRPGSGKDEIVAFRPPGTEAEIFTIANNGRVNPGKARPLVSSGEYITSMVTSGGFNDLEYDYWDE
ncbi:uncharacterized protein L201_002533 [Kwoniella dendrophila CBS 6074]|uniref:Uncharacterized protein n=1 Tax=Kwoniella dendrophila CBS 6074 TaxID=1295534 RepID=A0AAX4JT51_9TREE